MLKRNSNKFLAALLCVATLLIVSCAHKSGHKRDGERQGTEMFDKADSNSSQSRSRKVEIVNKRSNVKMEGAQIFERFGNAVFMTYGLPCCPFL